MNRKSTVLELLVQNHPGVMSHVCGLFSRRAYNMEGILCLPVGDGRQSRIWLKVTDDQALEQMMKQIRKLEDVSEVKIRAADREVFSGLDVFLSSTFSPAWAGEKG